MRYIYRITSPNQKIYIGQSIVPEARKRTFYRYLEKSDKTNRKIINAIKKHGWDNMLFEIIERNDSWSLEELSQREIYWIAFYDSVMQGYNISSGGDSNDPETARFYAKKYHLSLTNEQRTERSKNCSKGQKKRFKDRPDSIETKKKKSDSHKQSYRIESPTGQIWVTHEGLKDFANNMGDRLGVSYWSLFNAYRKFYTQTATTHERKNINRWKVEKIDERDN